MAEGFLFVDDLVQRLCGTRQSKLGKANSAKQTRQSKLARRPISRTNQVLSPVGRRRNASAKKRFGDDKFVRRVCLNGIFCQLTDEPRVVSEPVVDLRSFGLGDWLQATTLLDRIYKPTSSDSGQAEIQSQNKQTNKQPLLGRFSLG